MEFLFFFSLAGVIIVSLILKFDKKQAVKVKAVLKESRNVPPLFTVTLPVVPLPVSMPPLITAGDDYLGLTRFVRNGHLNYSAKQVLEYLLARTLSVASA